MFKLIVPVVLSLLPFAGQTQKKANIEKEIRRLEQLAVNAVLNADSNFLKQIWDPEFMVNTPRNDIAENRDAVFEIQKKGQINYSRFERNIEKVLVQKNVVITMGNEIFVSRTDVPGSKAGEAVTRRFSNVWMRKGGAWKQIARHASIICP